MPSLKKIILLLLIPIFKLANLFIFKKKSSLVIVVYNSGKLGDLVCSTPIYKAIKEAHPNKTLISITRSAFAEIFSNNPYIDVKLEFSNDQQMQNIGYLNQIRKKLSLYKIQTYFNINGSFEGGILGLYVPAKKRFDFTTRYASTSQKIINFFYQTYLFKFDKQQKEAYFDILAKAKIKVSNIHNQLFFPQPEPSAVTDYFKQNNLDSKKPIIGITVDSGKSFKQWPEKYWIELIKRLITNHQAAILFFGTQNEKEKIDHIKKQIKNITYCVIQPELKLLPYYLKRCHLFISVDTGPLYVADALHVPVVDIIGPVEENHQGPENIFRIVTNPDKCPKLLCTPAPPQCYTPQNLKKVKSCFDSITDGQVLKASEELLKNK